MGLLEDFQTYLSRSGRNLGMGMNSIADWMRPMAQNGLMTYNGALTGRDAPYYGDDEISAAREYFDSQPRSNLSRLMELGTSYMPAGKVGKAGVVFQAGEDARGLAPVARRANDEVSQGLQNIPDAKAQARNLQAQGTHGDTILAHINPAEAKLLDILSDGRVDGGGRNPTTGLPSFGMSDSEAGGYGGYGGNTDSNPGGVGGGPAGGNTGGGIGGNTGDGAGGLSGGYSSDPYSGSFGAVGAGMLGDYYQGGFINGEVDSPYAEKGTWTRLAQELVHPSLQHEKYGLPTGMNPNIVRTLGGLFGGPAVSGLMGLGAAMGRAGGEYDAAVSNSNSSDPTNGLAGMLGASGGGMPMQQALQGATMTGPSGTRPTVGPQQPGTQAPSQTNILAVAPQEDPLQAGLRDYILNGDKRDTKKRMGLGLLGSFL